MVRQPSAPPVSFDADTEITLGLLSVVEENSQVTQRSAAKELGIALGLTNAYLKRCVKKGLIKVQQVPANRYAYYLTPKGFAEKSRLTREYLAVSFNFFREARKQCKIMFRKCESRGWRSIVFCGNSDFVEIALLVARDFDVVLAGVVDKKSALQLPSGMEHYRCIEDVRRPDAIIITDLINPQQTFDTVAKFVDPERILAPRFLNISRVQPTLVE